jgi:hypothetical protein
MTTREESATKWWPGGAVEYEENVAYVSNQVILKYKSYELWLD